MKKLIQKNKKQRKFFKHFEKKRLILKSISKNFFFEKKIRFQMQQKFLTFSNDSSLTRIKNRCILTGRSKSIYRFFKFSRIVLRKLGSKGDLIGFSKISW